MSGHSLDTSVESPSPDPGTLGLARGLLQGLQQRGEVARAVVAPTVDEEHRRAVDSATHTGVEVLADPSGVDASRQLLLHATRVETEAFRATNEVAVGESGRVGEERLVH